MKIVVFSDIHGNKQILERILSFNPDADYFLSLGDTELPMDYLLDLDIIAVKGNYPRDPGVGWNHFLTLNGKKIMMTHGHKLGVHKNLTKLMKVAFQNDCDIVLYGHTHIAKIDKAQQLMIVNPGSAYRSRTIFAPSYLVLDIDDQGNATFTFRESETNAVFNLEL